MIYWVVATIVGWILFSVFFYVRMGKVINKKIKTATLRELNTNVEMSIQFINASLELIDKKSKVCYRLLHQAEKQFRKTPKNSYEPEKIIDSLPPDQVELTNNSAKPSKEIVLTAHQKNTNLSASAAIAPAFVTTSSVSSLLENSKNKKEIKKNTVTSTNVANANREGLSLREFAHQCIRIFRPTSRNKKHANPVKEKSRSQPVERLTPQYEAELSQGTLPIPSRNVNDDKKDSKSNKPANEKTLHENTKKIMETLLVEQFKECKNIPDQLQYWVQLAMRKGYSLVQIATFAELDVAHIQLLTKLPKLKGKSANQNSLYRESHSLASERKNTAKAMS